VKSDIRIRLIAAARVEKICFPCPHFHEIPLDAGVVGCEIHTVVNLVELTTSVPSMSQINLIDQSTARLVSSQIQTDLKQGFQILLIIN